MKKIIILFLCLPFIMFAQDSQKRKDKIKQQSESFETIEIGSNIPKIKNKLKSVDGDMYSIMPVKENNGLIVIFTCNTCPFVVMWEDRYKLVEEIAKENNLDLFYVNSNYKKRDGDDSFEKMQDHAKKMNYQFPYVLDKKSELANKFGAKTTPHIFLFSNENKLVYKGSIDDNHKDIKSVKKFYLKDAIKQLIAKETVEPNETKAVGCSIKRYKL